MALLLPGSAASAAGQREEIAAKVISCFKAGSDSIATMYSCSGAWVTPRILTLCFLEADCPIIPDTLDARQLVAAAVGGQDKLDQKLSIDLANALELPSRPVIDDCLKSTKDDKVFKDCVSKKMPSPAVAPLLSCTSMTSSDSEKALCLTKSSPKEVASVVECVSNQGVSTAALQQCTKIQHWDKVQEVASCVSQATSSSAKADCLTTGFGPAQKSLGQCLLGSNDRSTDALNCLGKLDPQAATRMEEVACAGKAGANQNALMGCFSKSMKGDEAKLAACAVGDKSKLASCRHRQLGICISTESAMG
jgi:hypothetical protein